jgi:hypothetical protein
MTRQLWMKPRQERSENGAKNAPQPPISSPAVAFDGPSRPEAASQTLAATNITTPSGEPTSAKMHHLTCAGSAAGSLSAADPATSTSKRPRLTDEEIARVLTYVECGLSLRQASAAIGRNHASVLRVIRRNPTFVTEYRRRRELARERPLRHLHEASQKSWRAAAWLLTYLDGLQQELPRNRRRRAMSHPRHPEDIDVSPSDAAQREIRTYDDGKSQ